MSGATTVVIGSGVAAAAIARRLLTNDASARVIVLEAGGDFHVADYRQWLDFVMTQVPPTRVFEEDKGGSEINEDGGFGLAGARLFCRGGATNHWGGWCPRMKPEDFHDLKKLVEFLKDYQVAEFDLDRGDLKIRLKFSQPAAPAAGLSELARMLATAPPTGASVAPAASSAQPAPAAAPEVDPDAGLHMVKSPIVGTYYGSPSPGASAFVAPGDHVEKGQVICIIEAMKLMNEIEADATGEVVKCLVSNGQPIEYGQPLFAIREG